MGPYIATWFNPGINTSQDAMDVAIEPIIEARETYFLAFKVRVNVPIPISATNHDEKKAVEKVHAAAFPPLKEAKIG